MKALGAFYRNTSAADGLDTYCKRCRTARNIISNPARSHTWLMLSAARSRAKKQGVPFDLTVADITIPTHCPILGIPLKRGKGQPAPTSPSLDKIIPALGYVRGNVAVISMRANSLKSNATLGELQAIVGFLEAHQGKTNEHHQVDP